MIHIRRGYPYRPLPFSVATADTKRELVMLAGTLGIPAGEDRLLLTRAQLEAVRPPGWIPARLRRHIGSLIAEE